MPVFERNTLMFSQQIINIKLCLRYSLNSKMRIYTCQGVASIWIYRKNGSYGHQLNLHYE